MRRVMTVVLPVPAPATMRSGPVSWVTASRCASLRPSRIPPPMRPDYSISGGHPGRRRGRLTPGIVATGTLSPAVGVSTLLDVSKGIQKVVILPGYMRENGKRAPRRVVITGMGAVTPIGMGVNDFWSALLAGKSGIRHITTFDASNLPSQVAGEVHNFHVREFVRHGRRPPIARFSAFAVAAARLAVDHAKLSRNAGPVGVCIGSSVQGNADIGEGAFARFQELGWQSLGTGPSLEVAAHSASSYVQGELQVAGPLMTIASACCTGIDAIAWGEDQIRT